jgi:hypothetical protein
MRRAMAMALGLLGGVLGLSRPARAAEGLPSIGWTADPGGCLDAPSAHAALRRVLGGAEPKSDVVTAVNVIIDRASNGAWRARVAMRGPNYVGDREFSGDSCSAVSQAAVLVVAMTFDPVGVVERVKLPAARSPAASFSLGLKAAGDLGSMPGSTVGIGLVLGVESGRARAEVEGVAWVPRLASDGSAPNAGGQVGLYSGAIHGCFDLVGSIDTGLDVGPCAGAELGASTGQGVGIARPLHPSGLWAALLAGVTVRGSASPGFFWWFSAEAGLSIRRPVYAVAGLGPIFQASPVIGRASLGVGWRFGR